MIKVGIIGATGYTGIELIRLLINHPKVVLHVVCSNSKYGIQLIDYLPNIVSKNNLIFSKNDDEKLLECEVVFFATPHGTVTDKVKYLLDKNVRVIDLSADFRLNDKNIWQKYYNTEHSQPQLLSHAVYGLPEINREKIKNAKLIANPGCYPTAVILGILPIIEQIPDSVHSIICDCKSGVSGAGKKAIMNNLFCEVSENFKAYSIGGIHRHYPEIKQTIERVSSIRDKSLIFTPHLLPMSRGMLATIYLQLNNSNNLDNEKLKELYLNYYKNEPFVNILADKLPETRYVRGSNHCQISVQKSSHYATIMIVCVIDNLLKGASGQAVQNMNIMFSLDEKAGLEQIEL